MFKKKILICLFIGITCICFGQSADFVTKMINAESVTYEDVAYLCATNLGLILDDATPEEAMLALDKAGIYDMPNNPKAEISYESLANMCTKTWKIKGGFLYSITKSDRYAFKELQSLGFIYTNVDPKETVSGIEVLNLITRCLDL